MRTSIRALVLTAALGLAPVFFAFAQATQPATNAPRGAAAGRDRAR